MTWRDRWLAFERETLRLARRWWRPVTCIWISATMAVHGVILPLFYAKDTDLTGLSLLVTACAGAFAVREWGKTKGLKDDGE